MLQKKTNHELEEDSATESLGLLASGIAHDFNNILTSILGNIQLSKMLLEENKDPKIEEINDFLDEAEKGIENAKKLTQQLLTFSKGGPLSKEIIDITNLLHETIIFTLSGSNVSCDYFIDNNISNVSVDQTQISRVIHNVVMNAIQAMPIGGSIRIFAENIIINSNNEDGNYDFIMEHGKYLKITIQDFGIGISNEDLPFVFEPMYRGTNKVIGKGMGLTVALSIMKQHNGYIDLISEEDVGTSVFIYFPAMEEVINIKSEEREDFYYGEGRILIMDDEAIIRKVLNRMIKHLGYEVHSATNGEQAISIFREFKEKGTPFDVLIFDLTIKGGLGGKETIKKILEIDPNAKVIATSGYSTDPVMENFSKFGFSGTLVKPYRIKELDKELYKLQKNHKNLNLNQN